MKHLMPQEARLGGINGIGYLSEVTEGGVRRLTGVFECVVKRDRAALRDRHQWDVPFVFEGVLYREKEAPRPCSCSVFVTRLPARRGPIPLRVSGEPRFVD